MPSVINSFTCIWHESACKSFKPGCRFYAAKHFGYYFDKVIIKVFCHYSNDKKSWVLVHKLSWQVLTSKVIVHNIKKFFAATPLLIKLNHLFLYTLPIISQDLAVHKSITGKHAYLITFAFFWHNDQGIIFLFKKLSKRYWGYLIYFVINFYCFPCLNLKYLLEKLGGFVSLI